MNVLKKLVVGSLVSLCVVHAVAQESEPKLLSDMGQALKRYGITPHFIGSYAYFSNPSTGVETGKNEQMGVLMAGFDADLQKMNLIHGGTIHFEQMWFPYHHNLDYGSQAGSILVGNPPPYVPKVAHLSRFTYEQRLFDDKLSVEFGKSNPGAFYGKSLCIYEFSCVNPVLQKTAYFSAAPYAGWGARIAYEIMPKLVLSAGAWRTYGAFPFTNGWEKGWDSKRVYDDEGNLYIAGLVRKEEWRDTAYPTTWELFFFRNDHRYEDSYYTVNGTSLATDKTSPPRMHSGMTGMHLGAKTVVWRKDGGNKEKSSPTTLSLYGNFSHIFTQNVYTGLRTYANAGLILAAPFESRPMDSYGLNFNVARITKDKQRFLTESYLGQDHWQPKRTEYQVSLDATIPATPDVILQVSAARTWNTTTWMQPEVNKAPKDGYSVNFSVTILMDQLLGLVERDN